MSKTCWYCNFENEQIADNFLGDFNCSHCGVENSVLNPAQPDWLPTEEEEMGELARRAKEKSPYIKLEIGESSEPLIYKSWKEISGQFGDSFRYAFEIQTEKGFIQKTFDCFQEHFAEQMDAIPFGATVIIHRKQKIDGNGNPMENKSIYEVSEAR
jgi:hypothetical protein